MTNLVDMTSNLNPGALSELHDALARQVLTEEEGPSAKELDAGAVRKRARQKKAEEEGRYRQELDRRNRPLWVHYHRNLAAALDRRAQEHRERADKIEMGVSGNGVGNTESSSP